MLRYLIKTLLQMNLFADSMGRESNSTDMLFNTTSMPFFNSSDLDLGNFTSFNSSGQTPELLDLTHCWCWKQMHINPQMHDMSSAATAQSRMANDIISPMSAHANADSQRKYVHMPLPSFVRVSLSVCVMLK